VVVLHAAWLDDALHLWAVQGSTGAASARMPATATPDAASPATVPRLPGAAGLDLLGRVVAAVAAPPAPPVPVEAFAWLPTLQGRPVLADDPLCRAPAAAKTPAHVPALAPWRVPTLSLPWRTTFALLGACQEERPCIAGCAAGADLLAWADLFRYAGALVARQAYLPALLRTAAGYEARWQPTGDGADRQRLYVLASHLPGVARCLSLPDAAAPTAPSVAVATAFVAEAVDNLVRLAAVTTLSRAHAVRGRYFSAHDAWLAALRGDSRTVRWDAMADLAALTASIDAWRRPIDLAARASWRLMLRLEEPAGTGHTWFLRYFAQPFAQPEEARPLNTLWHGRAAEASDRELALRSLAQTATLCAPASRGLAAGQMDGCALSTGEAHTFLTQQAPRLEAAGFGVAVPTWWTGAETRPRVELLACATATDTTEPRLCSLASLTTVDWSIALGGEPVTFEELEQLAQTGERLVRFRNRWIELDGRQADEAMRLWHRRRAEARSAGDIVRLMIGLDREAHGLRIGGVQANGWLGTLLQRLRGESAPDDLPPPAGFHGSLRPYQLRGYAWMAFLRRWRLGACLADDMGLGKTIQALAVIAQARETGEKRPVLLVCPTSLISNWQREAARFTPDLSVMRHHGPERLPGDLFVAEAGGQALVITSYALLPRDYATLRRVAWAGIVLDEAQNIKNPDTRQSQAARALTADYRLALTGTPVENHAGDLWSIMDFLNPGLLGARAAFRDHILRPIQAGVDPTARERLRRATQPFLMRRLKTDRSIIADLPEKIEARVFCPLTREQAALYAAVLQELDASLEGAEGIARRGLVLATLTRLKQVCNHPAHYLAEHDVALAGRSGKLDRITEMLEEVVASGDRALVFTQFARMGTLLQRHFARTFGFEPPFLHGGLTPQARDALVTSFQSEDGPPIFVLSLRAGGFGLNLTRANHVFHFDRWWNPAVENQATDRAFRIGQTRDVMVHKLVCAGTLEDRIDALIASKTDLAEQVVGRGETWLTDLPDDELKKMLALAPGAVVDETEG